jgi:hypothetical protein
LAIDIVIPSSRPATRHDRLADPVPRSKKMLVLRAVAPIRSQPTISWLEKPARHHRTQPHDSGIVELVCDSRRFTERCNSIF